MNILCPEDIEWKLVTSMGLDNEHIQKYRNEQFGFQMEIYTKKKSDFEFGKPKIYYFRDDCEKEYNDLQILCDDWNEVKNYDDETTEVTWVKVIKNKKIEAMITKLYKTAPTAVNYLTDPLSPYKLKEQKYKEKQKAKWVKELSPEEVKHLKSSVSQAFVTTQLQIECIDTIFEIQHVDKHFPLLKDFQNEMLRLSGELREISIKDESDDANRLQIEKMIEGIVKEMPTMNLKQLQMLQEFTTNLKFKK